MQSLLALFCLGSLPLQALIFPIRNQTYDGAYNNISISEMNQRGHLQGEIGTGLLATPVGPFHFVTAGHADTAGKIYYKGRTYLVETQIVHQFMDIKLVRVTPQLPDYVQLQRTNVVKGDWITIYGKSGVPAAPCIERNGEVKGWNIHFKIPPGPNENWRPRWGRVQIERVFEGSLGYPWDGTNTDCPTFAIGDSGGAAFYQHRFVGLIDKAGSPSPFRLTVDGPNRIGFIFDYHDIFDSFGRPATRENLTWNQILNITGFASWIYSHTTPPVRVAFGRSLPGWLEGKASKVIRAANPPKPPPSGTNADRDELLRAPVAQEAHKQAAAVPPQAETFSNRLKAVPLEIYEQAAVVESSSGSIVFPGRDFLIHEPYMIRLHFSPILGETPGAISQKLVINGKSVLDRFDPFPTANLCNVVEVKDIFPDRQGRIQVAIQPAGGKKATLSAMEILLQP